MKWILYDMAFMKVFYSTVSVLFAWRYSTVTVLLAWQYSTVLVLLACCTVPSRCFLRDGTVPSYNHYQKINTTNTQLITVHPTPQGQTIMSKMLDILWMNLIYKNSINDIFLTLILYETQHFFSLIFYPQNYVKPIILLNPKKYEQSLTVRNPSF